MLCTVDIPIPYPLNISLMSQGCATLSDRSFVLVKDSLEGTIQLGILAQSLQREEGPYLPSFTFSSSVSLKDQMVRKFSKHKHLNVKRCIEEYGAASHASDPDFLIGIERLCRHANSISSNTFAENPYVFLLVLDKVHHHQTNEYVQDQWDAQQKKTVKDLLKELEVGLPKTYLHIPNNFDFTIGGKNVDFAKYWTARLVELSSFTVNINKRIPFQQNFEHQDTYELRIFVGFDTMRVTEPSAGKEASLYVYSRQSGRLITQYDDARTLLKLSAGGTTFCQGLTVIIDDIGGQLPLNPTKEQIAFGEEDRGETHKDNLFAWIGCMIHFYYNHQLEKFGKKKTALTKKVAELSDNLQTRGLKSLDSSSFTTYQLTSKPIGQNIRVDKSSVKELPGKDTLSRLKTSKSSGAKSSRSTTASASTTTNGRKRKATNIELQQLSDDIPRRKKPVSYRETETDEEEEDGEVGGSDDERKLPARRTTQNGRGNANDSTDQSMSENTKTTEEQAARDPYTKAYYMDLCGDLTQRRLKDKAKIKELKKKVKQLEKQMKEE